MLKFKAAALGAIMALGSMSGAFAAQSSEPLFQVFYYNLGDPFIAAFNEDLKEEIRLADIKIKVFDATDNAFAQSEQIDAVLTSKRQDPLLLNLVDTSYAKTIAAALRDSQRAPIIFFNRTVDPEVLKSNASLWYIGANAVDSGVYQTEILVDYLKAHDDADRNGNGVIDIVMLKGEANHTDAIERTQAVLDTLNKSGIPYKVTYTDNADWNFQKAFDSMDRAVSRLSINNIEAVICNNDAMALGAVMALNQYDYNLPDSKTDKFIPVVGIDAIDDALAAIREGRMLGTVCNDAQLMSKIAVAIVKLNTRDESLVSKTIGLPVKDHQIIVPYLKVQSAVRR